MKTLLALIILTFTQHSYASGCAPSDVYLADEAVITSLPQKFKGHLNCYEGGRCSLYTYSDLPGQIREYYDLELVGSNQNLPSSSFENLEVKIFKQFFVSSCTEMFRIVPGVDINGMRFRSEKDLDYL